MVPIPQPAFVLSSEDVPGCHYVMQFNGEVPLDMDPDAVLATVANIARWTRMKALIINCHGLYGSASADAPQRGFS